MGLFDRIVKTLGGSVDNDTRTTDTDGDDERGGGLAFDLTREGLVDVDRRTDIIDANYDGVDEDEAQLIAETLQNTLEGEDSLSRTEAVDRIQAATGLSRERATEIHWTERESIQHMDSIADYYETDIATGVSILGGGCEPPVCDEAAAEVDDRGGAVTPEELQTILRSKAETYDEEGGTPDRIDHWVAHHKCRSTIQLEID